MAKIEDRAFFGPYFKRKDLDHMNDGVITWRMTKYRDDIKLPMDKYRSDLKRLYENKTD